MFVGTGLLQGAKNLDNSIAGILLANKVYERIWEKRSDRNIIRMMHIVCLCISRLHLLLYLGYCPGASVGPVPLFQTVHCLFGPSRVEQASHRASRRLWTRWCSSLASVHRWSCWLCPGFVWNKAEWNEEEGKAPVGSLFLLTQFCGKVQPITIYIIMANPNSPTQSPPSRSSCHCQREYGSPPVGWWRAQKGFPLVPF